MSEVVYAIRISHLEYSGLKIMDIKIGKSTNIDNTLRQYSRGNRDIELLDMWTPNAEKTLSTAERGVHAVAERYAYDKQSEKFVFLQGAYQDFAETVNKLLRNASREDLSEEPKSGESEEIDDFTGMTPSVIKILGVTHDVDSWADAVTVAVAEILRDADDYEDHGDRGPDAELFRGGGATVRSRQAAKDPRYQSVSRKQLLRE